MIKHGFLVCCSVNNGRTLLRRRRRPPCASYRLMRCSKNGRDRRAPRVVKRRRGCPVGTAEVPLIAAGVAAPPKTSSSRDEPALTGLVTPHYDSRSERTF